MIWTSGLAVAMSLARELAAIRGETLRDVDLADPSLDNDVLISQMMRSMQAGF